MGSKLLEEIKNNAKKLNKTIVLPESHDERALKAAEILAREKRVSVITLGNDDQVRSITK